MNHRKIRRIADTELDIPQDFDPEKVGAILGLSRDEWYASGDKFYTTKDVDKRQPDVVLRPSKPVTQEDLNQCVCDETQKQEAEDDREFSRNHDRILKVLIDNVMLVPSVSTKDRELLEKASASLGRRLKRKKNR